MKTVFTLLIFVLYVYRIHFNFFTFDIFTYFYALSSIAYILNFRKDFYAILQTVGGKTKSVIYLSAFMLFIALIWGILVIWINDGEYSYIVYLLNSFGMVAIHSALVLFVYKLFPNKNLLITFCDFYITAAVIYILSTLVMVVLPEFKENWWQIIMASERTVQVIDDFHPTRVGLRGVSTVQVSFINNIAVILCIYCMQYKHSFKYIIIGAFLLLGDLLYARWGIVASLGILIIYFVIGVNKSRTFKKLLIMICSFFIIVSIVLYCSFDAQTLSLIVHWITQPIDAFFDGLKYGQFTLGSSGDHLVDDMYFMPSDHTLLFGDGKFVNNDQSYYGYTDAGVMRNILFYGLIGELLGYSSFILFIGSLLVINRNRFIFFAMLFLFFFAEAKFNAFYDLYGVGSSLILAMGYSFDRKNMW